jgi:hypothetical protein
LSVTVITAQLIEQAEPDALRALLLGEAENGQRAFVIGDIQQPIPALRIYGVWQHDWEWSRLVSAHWNERDAVRAADKHNASLGDLRARDPVLYEHECHRIEAIEVA